MLVLSTLALLSVATDDCGLTVAESRARAAELFSQGDVAGADACLGTALSQATTQLEALAAEAESIRAYRVARRQHPGATSSCVLDAHGASLCLDGAGSQQLSNSLPKAVRECSGEAQAVALLQRVQRGEHEMDSTSLEAGVAHAAQRHWWDAARRALDLLRNRNHAISSEARHVVTVLRDEASSVLSLMRQTKMDETTISCAVMWAQGEASVHLLVKFAMRLDAPVTVLNVDNEQVVINTTHVIFSGVGRQKPKKYVINIELFGAIMPENSSWSFGSVGTVRFRLAKNETQEWPRLTASTEPVKNHRVWWEGQEQIVAEEKKLKREAEMRQYAAEAEARRLHEVEARAEREASEAEAWQKAREHAVARRVVLLPLLETAIAAAAELAAQQDAAAEGDQASELSRVFDASTTATAALVLEAEVNNETTIATASQLLTQVRSLASTGYKELTKDALQQTLDHFNELCTTMVPPEPEPEPAEPEAAKKKPKKKKRRKAKRVASAA